jgi:hypothetical protein
MLSSKKYIKSHDSSKTEFISHEILISRGDLTNTFIFSVVGLLNQVYLVILTGSLSALDSII